jgi:hypothetical protein
MNLPLAKVSVGYEGNAHIASNPLPQKPTLGGICLDI